MKHGRHAAEHDAIDAEQPSASLARLANIGDQSEPEMPASDGGNSRPYWLPDKLYDLLKWVGLLLLPALGLFAGKVGPIWGWPHVDEFVATLNAVGVLIAALIGVSQASPSAKTYFGI